MPRPLRWLIGLLTVAPAAWVAWGLFNHAVNIPFYDAWHEAPLVVRFHDGTLSWADVWAPYNHHRLLFSRLLWLPLSRLTHWNNLAECGASWFLGWAWLGIFWYWLRQPPLSRLSRIKPVLFLVWAWLCFSLNQLPRWLYGFHLQIPLSIAFALAGLTCLLPDRFSWRRWILAAAFGILSSYSFSSGLCFWPAALVLLGFQSFDSPQTRRQCLFLWSLAGAIVVFFHQWNPASHGVSADKILLPDIFLIVPGVCLYLASSFLLIEPLIKAIGILGLSYFISEFVFFLRSDKKERIQILFLALGLFAIVNALLTAVTRGSVSPDTFTAVRYAPIRNLFWIALTGLAVLRFAQWASKRSESWVILLLLAFFAQLALDNQLIWKDFLWFSGRFQVLSDSVLAGDRSDYIMDGLYPRSGETARQLLPELEKHKLSLFSKT